MRFKLNFFLFILVTVVLVVASIFSVITLRSELEARFEARKQDISEKLRVNLAQALWNFDEHQAENVIDAELGSQDVLAIRVFDEGERLFLEKFRDGASSVQAKDVARVQLHWHVSPSPDIAAMKRDAQLGFVEIHFSRESLERVMFQQIRNRIIEIITLNVLLGVALYLAMSRIVIRPLQELAKAFKELASHAQVGELHVKGEDEFGEVVEAYNQIERRLVSDIERRREAEKGLLKANKELSDALETLKLAKDSLVQSEKFASLGQLVAGVAHEINTPVGVALTGASCLIEESRKMRALVNQGTLRKSELTQFIELMNEGAQLVLNNTERAAHLIQSFKQVAADETSEERRPFAMKDYLVEVLTSLRPKYKHTRIKVSCDCPDGVDMNTYPGLLAQVLTNLLVNALVHGFESDDEGEVAISVTDDGGWVEVECRNNGKPIPAEHLPRIFDPFFTTRRSQGGTGLGLNIVANIVTQRLGGTIRVSSDPEMTRFVVRIPKVFSKKEAVGVLGERFENA